MTHPSGVQTGFPRHDGGGRSVVAVVLAGGVTDAMARGAGVRTKALAPYAGRALGAYVLEALAGSPRVREIIWVGPTDPTIDRFAPTVARGGDDMAGSFTAGMEVALERAAEGERLLVLSADLPWLTSDAVSDFVRNAPEADAIYSIVRRAVSEAEFPHQKRTYARVREGVFTGGNLFLLTQAGAERILPLVNRLYARRKNPLALGALVGPWFVLKFALGLASIAEAERAASRVLGVRARAYESPHACVGADIDDAAQLAANAGGTPRRAL